MRKIIRRSERRRDDNDLNKQVNKTIKSAKKFNRSLDVTFSSGSYAIKNRTLGNFALFGVSGVLSVINALRYIGNAREAVRTVQSPKV